MPRYRSRSRSRTSFKRKEKWVYKHDASSSDSEEDECRGRPTYRYISLVGPRSHSNTRIVINNLGDNYFDGDGYYDTAIHFDSRSPSPAQPPPPAAEPPAFHPIQNCWGHMHHFHQHAGGNQFYHHASDKDKKEKAAKKARDEQLEKDRKEYEKMKGRMRELEQRFNQTTNLPAPEPRSLLDIDHDIASTNATIMGFDARRHRNRQHRATSRPRVAFANPMPDYVL